MIHCGTTVATESLNLPSPPLPQTRQTSSFPSPPKGRGVVPFRPSIFTFILPLSFFLSSFFFFDRFLFCFFSPSFFTRFVALLSGCSIRFRFIDDRGGRIS